jgi:hypothetical protein
VRRVDGDVLGSAARQTADKSSVHEAARAERRAADDALVGLVLRSTEVMELLDLRTRLAKGLRSTGAGNAVTSRVSWTAPYVPLAYPLRVPSTTGPRIGRSKMTPTAERDSAQRPPAASEGDDEDDDIVGEDDDEHAPSIAHAAPTTAIK